MRLLHHQRQIVIAAADKSPEEKRQLFLERIGARLELFGFRLSDDELTAAPGQQPAA